MIARQQRQQSESAMSPCFSLFPFWHQASRGFFFGSLTSASCCVCP